MTQIPAEAWAWANANPIPAVLVALAVIYRIPIAAAFARIYNRLFSNGHGVRFEITAIDRRLAYREEMKAIKKDLTDIKLLLAGVKPVVNDSLTTDPCRHELRGGER